VITIRVDTRDFDRLSRDIVSYARIVSLAIAVRATKEQVLADAAAGRNADGSSKGKYSAGHAKRRQKRGLQTDHIDFRFSGNLLNSLHVMGGTMLTVASQLQEQAEGLTRMKGEWLAASDKTVATIERTLASGFTTIR
jgi:hypothetical protein